MITLKLDEDLIWSSDWNGYAVGFPDVAVVGLYTLKDTKLNLYIDIETMKILDGWKEDDE
jgi:hypothetical protein